MVTPTPTTVQVKIQLRGDTAANWASVNPVLLNNELGLETDTKKLKVGNGSTAWNSLTYFPSIVTGGTVLGNLEIGTTGTLTFEGSTADGFETTLGVINPTADRTINLPNQSGTVIVSGNASIVDADIASNAEIAVSKLADGAARQLLQTDAAGTGVEWTSNVDVPGTLDVTGAATFDAAVTIAGDLTVNGTTTNINTQNLVVEDKNIILADVATPTDTTADGGGITLKGATDKTINWVDATDAWTLSEHVNIASGKEYRINGTKVLDATSLGSSVLITSANITDGTIVNGDINASAAIAGTKISPDFGSQNVTTTGTATAAALIPSGSSVPSNGVYLPSANNVAISTNGTGRLFVDASGRILVGGSSVSGPFSDQGQLQVIKTDGGSAFATYRFTNDTGGSILYIGKSRGAIAGTNTAVIAGDTLGSIVFAGADGSSYQRAVSIRAIVGGTPGADPDMPGALLFEVTGDGSSTPSERMRLDSSGRLGLGTSSPYSRFTVLPASTPATVANANQITIGESTANSAYRLQIGYLFDSLGRGSIQAYDNNNASTLILNGAGGNVGIGTTSPGAALNIGNEGDLWLGSGDNTVEEKNVISWRIEDGSEGAYISTFREAIANAPHSILFGTRNSVGGIGERARIDSSGRLLVGTSNNRTGAALQIEGTTFGTSLGTITNNSANSAPAYFQLIKSRGTSLGSQALVSNGDGLGNVQFVGTDGTQQLVAAAIEGIVDGTPGTNDMPGRLVFSTTTDGASSPTERARITSGGYFKASNDGNYAGVAGSYHELRQTAGSSTIILQARNTSATGNGVQVDINSDGTAYAYLIGYSTSAAAHRIIVWSNGNVVNTNNSYGAISDIKLKENIVNANSQWDDLKGLQVRNYNFKEGQTHTQIGLVAQEVELVSPGLVSESPDRDEEGNDLGTVTKSINYSVLYMKAVKALQEAMERIEVLEQRLTDSGIA